jgi:tRNA threonylcarbamoyladenosine dehydratase
MHPFHRTELLVGSAGFERVSRASVCVIGVGGVGSYAVESLARSSVGHLTLVDFDRVCLTNLNRQIHATRKTTGRSKTALMEERILSIHPKCDVRAMPTFYDSYTADEILDRPYDVVLDCIDNMTAKVDLLERCVKRSIPVISAMGAGGRLDPTRIRVSDISETYNDPFARILRDLLRQRGINSGIQCVWTDELPNSVDDVLEAGFRCICPDVSDRVRHGCESRHQVQGSVSWMPAMFGLTMAGVAVNNWLGRDLADAKRPAKKVRQAPAAHRPSRSRKAEIMAEAALAGADESI